MESLVLHLSGFCLLVFFSFALNLGSDQGNWDSAGAAVTRQRWSP